MSEWIETAKQLPTEADATPNWGKVMAQWKDGDIVSIFWSSVVSEPQNMPRWQRITPPEPPEEKAFTQWEIGYVPHRHGFTAEVRQIIRSAFLAGVQWQKEQGK